MLAREWLVSKGLSKGTRGRLSTVAKAALQTAIENGSIFEDWNSKGKVEEAEVSYETPAKVHPHGRAVAVDNGEQISMKNACFHCSLSLYWCKCTSPMALGRKGSYREVIIYG